MRIRQATPCLIALFLMQLKIGQGAVIQPQASEDRLPATAVALSQPSRIAINSKGELFIADKEACVVFKVDTNGLLGIYAGTARAEFSGDGGPSSRASLNHPVGLAIDEAGNLFIADEGNNRIRKVDKAGIIITVAGTGTAGLEGDGGPATKAKLNRPSGIAIGKDGTLYIADRWNNVVRKVAKNGTIVTVAGTGRSGFNGDGKQAVMTQLASPADVALDEKDNLYIADSENDRVRKVDHEGLISTVARVLKPVSLVADTEQRLIVADSVKDRVCVITSLGFFDVIYRLDKFKTSSSTLQAGLAGLALDKDKNLYVIDNLLKVVRKIGGGREQIVAGGGSNNFGLAAMIALNVPSGVVVDSLGNLYISDRDSNRVLKVNPTGKVVVVAGSGLPGYSGDGIQAKIARLYGPQGLAINAKGELFIADTLNNLIRKVDSSDVITTVAGIGGYGAFSGDGGLATKAELHYPTGVALDKAGNLYIADKFNNRIRRVATNGIISTVAGKGDSKDKGGFSGDGGPAVNALLKGPERIALDADGNIIIADTGNDRVRQVDRNGVITTLFEKSKYDTSLYPLAVAVDREGTIFVADYIQKYIFKARKNEVLKIFVGSKDSLSSKKGTEAKLPFNRILDIALDNQGNIFVAGGEGTLFGDALGIQQVIRIDKSKRATRVAGNNLWSNNAKALFLTNNDLKEPSGIAMDERGNLFISDTGHHRVVKVNPNGTLNVVAGTGQPGRPTSGVPARDAYLNKPEGLVLDSEGNLFIADSENRVIQKVDREGIIYTLAGNGNFGYTGDGGPATRATLGLPNDVKVNSKGELIISDWGIAPLEQRFRKVTVDGTITALFSESQQVSQITQPYSIALDKSGNLFTADAEKRCIWKVSPDGQLSLVAGVEHQRGSSDDTYNEAPRPDKPFNTKLQLPMGVAINDSGDIFISDSRGHRVLKVTRDGLITIVAGDGFKDLRGTGRFKGDGGPATKASLCYPSKLLVDPTGNLYIVDSGNNRIRKVSPNGIIMTVAGY